MLCSVNRQKLVMINMFSFMDLKFIVVFIWLIFGHIKGNISLKNKNQHDNLEMRITLMIINSVK